MHTTNDPIYQYKLSTIYFWEKIRWSDFADLQHQSFSDSILLHDVIEENLNPMLFVLMHNKVFIDYSAKNLAYKNNHKTILETFPRYKYTERANI